MDIYPEIEFFSNRRSIFEKKNTDENEGGKAEAKKSKIGKINVDTSGVGV